MSPLFHAHSGVRFLILLVGVVAVVVCAVGHVQKKPLSTLARILGSAFVGLMHLQVLLGLVMVFTGVWYAQLTGHLVPMLLATVLAQVMVVKGRKSSSHLLPLIGIGGALLLIVVGVFAIGRTPFSMTIARPVG